MPSHKFWRAFSLLLAPKRRGETCNTFCQSYLYRASIHIMSVCETRSNPNQNILAHDQQRCNQSKLSTISNDCIAEIANKLVIESIAQLLTSGDKMLYEKLTNNILSLRHKPAHQKKICCSKVVSSVVVRCKNLKSLSMTRCMCDVDILDCSALPSSLVELTISPCPGCLYYPRPRMSCNGAPLCLPHLLRLDIDVSSIKHFPINLLASPLLESLRIYLRHGDPSVDVHDLLLHVPQLTHLAIETPSMSSGIDFSELDCASLPNLIHLSLPCNTRVKNVHKSFESIVLTLWDDHYSYNTLFECPNNFAALTSLNIGSLAGKHKHVNDKLVHLASIAPSLERLFVRVDPYVLTVNVFDLFPRLQKVRACLCSRPSFWSSVPTNVCLIPSPDVWSFAEWFENDDILMLDEEKIKKLMLSMPLFKRIYFNGTNNMDEFMMAIPERVLKNVNHLYLKSTAAAHRLVWLARRATIIVVDFFCHFVDFSNCTQLQELRLYDGDIQDSDVMDLANLKASIATIQPSVETLSCGVDANMLNEYGAVQTLLLNHLTRLCSFGISVRLDGDLDLLSSSLMHISLDYDWEEAALGARVAKFLEKRTFSSPLVRMAVFCRNETTTDFVCPDGWVMATEQFGGDIDEQVTHDTLKKFTWTRNGTAKN